MKYIKRQVTFSLRAADILLRHHCFPHGMTSEKRAQKFHTDYVSLNPDLVGASDWSCRVGNLLQLIRSAIQIWLVTRHQ